ncbi:CBS domain-containing protein [Liquorilactobacillus satsumensis]|nr:cyclic-di-AMP-binding protein CbpB [Liquorilactobacillus satsumensis]MCP9313241.1 CBS domain-containing protein [Liquorilactobacillus satsumensis]MCP9329493.1 CBS domain-containing protein [Liquorilactobacillus satsumensis]MCP9358178.1 CBS domain-containing protein [Liquorilactobacillus satsumensis]MCP9360398.1 CBS domain-containing protein [Liquorilactobacillus satsumensis]MCP9371750.1 CBS domain-containing protein [Liquorilactobacillus satsumensis]
MMIKPIEQMFVHRQDHFLIPAEMVANVQEDNNLDHAFLVLTKVKYATIPVLDKKQHFKGLLSLPMLTETMLGMNGIDPTRLGRKKVAEVMQTDVTTIKLPYDIEEILHLLVDQPFLVVVSDEGLFTGIVTRREIMKAVNFVAHDFDKYYAITAKEDLKLQN